MTVFELTINFASIGAWLNGVLIVWAGLIWQAELRQPVAAILKWCRLATVRMANDYAVRAKSARACSISSRQKQVSI